MDQEPYVVKEDPEAIRHRIEETRSSLTEKLETLEGQVRGTVEGAKATVEGTIETVRETVKDTVDTVKRTFDLNYQMQQRPWTLIGASVLAGFLIGALVSRGRPSRGRSRVSSYPDYAPASERSLASSAAAEPAASQGPGFLSGLMEQFGPEIDKIKGAAIGYLVGMARDSIKEALPSLGQQIEEVTDSVTTKLGGEPVEGPVMGSASHSSGSYQPSSY
jgi:ElaB/YqjD/DUF883 family membrane-anchored ribosome-binding protein